jgi:hypothetical protein
MADLSTKKDPLNLPNEKPDYVADTSGPEDSSLDQDAQPAVGTDPQDTGLDGDPTLRAPGLDEEKVKQAEREGKGF